MEITFKQSKWEKFINQLLEKHVDKAGVEIYDELVKTCSPYIDDNI